MNHKPEAMHCWSFSKQLHWPGAKLTSKSQQVSETIISKPLFKLTLKPLQINLQQRQIHAHTKAVAVLDISGLRRRALLAVQATWYSYVQVIEILSCCRILYIGKRWQKTSLLQNSDFEALPSPRRMFQMLFVYSLFQSFAHRKPSTWLLHSAHLYNVNWWHGSGPVTSQQEVLSVSPSARCLPWPNFLGKSS